jgi:hypothetical protein
MNLEEWPMTSMVRRAVLPPVAAAALLLAAAGSALADAESTVSVFNADGTAAGATVCEFYVEFSPAPGGESGAWELRDSGGSAVANGSYSVTASAGDREPDSGTMTFPNGTYTLLWDDEPVIDRSNSELEIVVECAEPTQSVAAETDTPTQSVAADTDKPSQDVEGETDAPHQTLPDTAGIDQPSRPDPGAWTGLIAALLGIGAFILVLTPRRGTTRR